MTEDLVLSVTPENLAIKEDLEKQIIGPKNSTRKRGVKKLPEKGVDQSENPEIKYKMDLNLPLTIKQALERDFVNVTLRNLLVNVPRTPNVETILANFVEDTLSNNPLEDRATLVEFTQGIITCFDFVLPLQLLYKEERSQLEREGFVHSGSRIKRQNLVGEVGGNWVLYPGYSTWGCQDQSVGNKQESKTNNVTKSNQCGQTVQDNQKNPGNQIKPGNHGNQTKQSSAIPGPLQPSKLYGAEHLLRLFVKLPELLDHLETEYLNSVAHYSQTFLDYVANHRAEVFVEIQPYKEAELCDMG